MKSFTNLKILIRKLDQTPSQRGLIYVIGFCTITLFILWLINLSQVWWWLQLTLFGLYIAIIVLLMRKVIARKQKKHYEELQRKVERLGAQPEYPPGHSESDPHTEELPSVNSDDPIELQKRAIQLLQEIAAAARDSQELDRMASEERERLFNDDTVYYSEIPGLPFFLRRGLPRILAAGVISILIVVISLQSADPIATSGIIVGTVALFLWYATKWIKDWRGTIRKAIGNDIIIDEPKNAFFGLNGGTYEVSVIECTNVAMMKSPFERFTGWPTQTISIDTDVKNHDEDDNAATSRKADKFKNMENMRHPERFKEHVRTRRNQLLSGMPNSTRRNFNQN